MVPPRQNRGAPPGHHRNLASIKFLGIESSPAYVREPEGNACAARFIRILKEQILWLRTFRTGEEELRYALHEFKERYNLEWIVERRAYRKANEAREGLVSAPESAA